MEVTRMRNRTKFTLSTIALALCSSVAIAQEDETGFFAKADTTLAHDDNIYRVTDDLAQSDTYLSVAPELKLIGGFGKQRFELSYDGDYSKFSDASDADYADHNIEGKIRLEHTSKFSTRFEARYIKDHEDPGSLNRIQLDLSEYNLYEQKIFLAGLAYGREDAIGKIAFHYRKTDNNQLNNSLDFLDYNSDQLMARFTYRVAPKTHLYIEAAFTDFDYQPAETFELDNNYKRYRAGLAWDFTNKLTGDISVGYQNRDYNQSSIRDISGLAYSGDVNWAINTYTTVAFHARRESIDSSLEEAGGFLRTTFGLRGTHKLTDLLEVIAEVGNSKDELVFTSAREDDRYLMQLGVKYEISRRISFGGTYKYEERKSTSSIAEYDANVFILNVTVSLDN